MNPEWKYGRDYIYTNPSKGNMRAINDPKVISAVQEIMPEYTTEDHDVREYKGKIKQVDYPVTKVETYPYSHKGITNYAQKKVWE
jgi:hypothetical protein